MGYYDYLCALLAPLGIYKLDEGIGAAELFAAGAALDKVGESLALAERESCLATAQGEGLARRFALFSRSGAMGTLCEQRKALAALCAVDANAFTLPLMNEAISGCGIEASVEETGDFAHLRVRFPGTVGEPQDFEKIKEILLVLLPCHAEVEFYFAYLTWRECEENGCTWGEVEDAEHTWRSFEESFAETVGE